MIMKAENVSKRYFRKTGSANYFLAVSPLDLELGGGEITVLMGRSGSGKTTLLNMLSGLLAPTEGRVLLEGTDLYGLDDRALSRLRSEKIGVVPQGRSAVDTLTVLENILLPSQLYGRTLPETEALQWMERLGIAHLRDARPAELSGGELSVRIFCSPTNPPATWMTRIQRWFWPRSMPMPMSRKRPYSL